MWIQSVRAVLVSERERSDGGLSNSYEHSLLVVGGRFVGPHKFKYEIHAGVAHAPTRITVETADSDLSKPDA
jgi:hypothetical protein